jgi:hypothetical protein
LTNSSKSQQRQNRPQELRSIQPTAQVSLYQQEKRAVQEIKSTYIVKKQADGISVLVPYYKTFQKPATNQVPTALHPSLQMTIKCSSSKFRIIAKMLVVRDNGEHRIITLTLPIETCTVQKSVGSSGISHQRRYKNRMHRKCPEMFKDRLHRFSWKP